MIINGFRNIFNEKVEVLNDDTVVFWSQPDFSYKSRVHIYNCNNTEIGYIQYKTTSTQIGNIVYFSDDEIVDLSSFSIDNQNDSKVSVLINDNIIGYFEYENENVIFSNVDSDFIDVYLLYIYSLLF